ncbi:hypothetical protein C5167_022011 [Papaver somniferum]|uniref:Pentacotripeptide-repeat region of PRORP domain-containing protein n=1 Tax=Papaver somniferum TaxID=3469 RepID=A0A4Y7JJQ0_PAPSO|nr:hypothetical protein C5167_022011 [Papaver somniferum]
MSSLLVLKFIIRRHTKSTGIVSRCQQIIVLEYRESVKALLTQLEFREYLKPSLPSHQKSNDADMVANLLIECHDPYHAMESSSLHLNGIRVSTELVQQTLIRLKNVPSIALDFFVWLLLEMDQLGDKSTSKTFGILFRRLIAAGLTRQAIQAFDDMERFTKRETDREDFVDLLDTLCMDMLRTVLHPGTHFEGIIQKAENLLDEMQKRGIEQEVTSYSIVLHVYSPAHKPDLSLDKLSSMKEKGIFPTVATYTSVIKCLCSCGRLEDAEEILNEMVANGVSSYPTTFSCFFKEFQGRKHADNALKLYKKMGDLSYGLVCVHKLPQQIRLEDAEDILNEMVANGVSSSPTNFSCFFKEFQGRKHADNALKLYKKMGDLSCTPSLSTYNILVGTFSRLNKMDIVQEIWNDMKESGAGPDSNSYTLLIHGLCEKRKWAEGCEFFQEMRVNIVHKRSHWRTWRRLKKKLEEYLNPFRS